MMSTWLRMLKHCVAVEEHKLSYHSPKTMLFGKNSYYGKLI